jgi:hypothetical protein
MKTVTRKLRAVPFGWDRSGAMAGRQWYSPQGPSLISRSVRTDIDSARTEPEATSPETDTPVRLFAEICYLLYQDL